MARNLGWGNTRDMERAGHYVLAHARAEGAIGFQSQRALEERWSLAVTWLRDQGIRDLKKVSPAAVAAYAGHLNARVAHGEIRPATAQVYLSAVNTVMKTATHGEWQSVRGVSDMHMAKRANVRTSAPHAMDRAAISRAAESLRSSGHDRLAAIVELCRNLGLRSEEASKCNAHNALQEARTQGTFTVNTGGKGGKWRTVAISAPGQLETLRIAANAQGSAPSMIPVGRTWLSWRRTALPLARAAVKAETGDARPLHALRAAYAVERHLAITGEGGGLFGHPRTISKARDVAARLAVGQELGHGPKRLDVAAHYVGSLQR